jgi:hypothetical protein
MASMPFLMRYITLRCTEVNPWPQGAGLDTRAGHVDLDREEGSLRTRCKDICCIRASWRCAIFFASIGVLVRRWKGVVCYQCAETGEGVCIAYCLVVGR